MAFIHFGIQKHIEKNVRNVWEQSSNGNKIKYYWNVYFSVDTEHADELSVCEHINIDFISVLFLQTSNPCREEKGVKVS
jgi:hypothetical protein